MVYAPTPRRYPGCWLGRRGQGWRRGQDSPSTTCPWGAALGGWATPCLYCSGLRKPLVQEHFALFLCSLSPPFSFFSPFPMKTLFFVVGVLFVVVDFFFFPKRSIVYLTTDSSPRFQTAVLALARSPAYCAPPPQPHQPPATATGTDVTAHVTHRCNTVVKTHQIPSFLPGFYL